MKRLAWGVAAVAAWTVTFGVGGVGCHEDEVVPGLEDVIYVGGATDEALDALLAADPLDDPAQEPVIEEPVGDAAVPAGAPATFRWRVGAATASLALPPDRSEGGARLGAWLFGGVPEAHAHGDPLTGEAFLLVLSTPDDDALVRVFTTSTTFTPDASTWETIAAQTGPITATVTRGVFDANRLAQDGGPYVSEPVSFTIGD